MRFTQSQVSKILEDIYNNKDELKVVNMFHGYFGDMHPAIKKHLSIQHQVTISFNIVKNCSNAFIKINCRFIPIRNLPA